MKEEVFKNDITKKTIYVTTCPHCLLEIEMVDYNNNVEKGSCKYCDCNFDVVDVNKKRYHKGDKFVHKTTKEEYVLIVTTNEKTLWLLETNTHMICEGFLNIHNTPITLQAIKNKWSHDLLSK